MVLPHRTAWWSGAGCPRHCFSICLLFEPSLRGDGVSLLSVQKVKVFCFVFLLCYLVVGNLARIYKVTLGPGSPISPGPFMSTKKQDNGERHSRKLSSVCIA